MQDKIIRWVRPYLVRNGRPTYIVRELLRTSHGRVLVAAMFQFYVKHCEHGNYSEWKLDTNIDIANHRWYQSDMFLDRLRKAGM